LPRTVSGKVRRIELRQRELSRVAPGAEFCADDFPELCP
jgi:acyl-coenzyme A synthetase/AMP-(fatty) acid ligase